MAKDCFLTISSPGLESATESSTRRAEPECSVQIQEALSMNRNRRQFLGGGLALGAVTAGSLSVTRSEMASSPQVGRRTVSWGWELYLNNSSAAAYFEVLQEMTLDFADIDLAYTITDPPATPGFVEALCSAGVSRGAPPNLDPAVETFARTQDFGDPHVTHPETLYGYSGAVFQDVFCVVILKTWIPADGAGSATYRNVSVNPSLDLNVGDFLVCLMGGDGVMPGDLEMQVVLGYTVGALPRVVTR
jgi:hypothetical protein